jgi:hypothetical protein
MRHQMSGSSPGGGMYGTCGGHQNGLSVVPVPGGRTRCLRLELRTAFRLCSIVVSKVISRFAHVRFQRNPKLSDCLGCALLFLFKIDKLDLDELSHYFVFG